MMQRMTTFSRQGLIAGLVTVLVLGTGILLGSRNLRNYDPTLLIYTFGALAQTGIKLRSGGGDDLLWLAETTFRRGSSIMAEGGHDFVDLTGGKIEGGLSLLLGPGNEANEDV